MGFIGIVLIVIGILCFRASTLAFGDIGLSFAAIGIVSILSGIAFRKVNKRLKLYEEHSEEST